MIAARLFTERLGDNEALVIVGGEQYSSSQGYADTFEWTGAHYDTGALRRWPLSISFD